MSEQDQYPQADVVDGELLDAAPVADSELDETVDEPTAIDGEILDGDDTDENGDAQAADGEGAGVMVLDTWQIQIPATGDEKVDAALARLLDVEGLPPSEHADVYEAVHAGLQDALADLDRT